MYIAPESVWIKEGIGFIIINGLGLILQRYKLIPWYYYLAANGGFALGILIGMLTT